MVKVSTIIPAYNAERTIVQAIDSALSQDYEGQEIVVVNDGSTDMTAAILGKYGGEIQVITQRNRGLSAARNTAVCRSTGKYLALLDADDIWLPGKLKTMVSALERNPSASLAFSDYRWIDDKGAHGGSSVCDVAGLQRLMSESPLPVYSFPTSILPSTWVMPRQVVERIGGFCEDFKGAGGCDDAWILLLLRELGEFIHVPEKLIVYRFVESGKTADKYGPGLSIFIYLVKERYGAKGKALIRDAKNSQCRGLLSKVAYQMNDGDRLGALRTLARIVKLRPAFFFTPAFRGRLFLPHNLKRVRDLVAVLG